MEYYTILYYTILFYTILYYTILYYTIPYYAIPYYTILYYTILYYIFLYSTLLYYTILLLHYWARRGLYHPPGLGACEPHVGLAALNINKQAGKTSASCRWQGRRGRERNVSIPRTSSEVFRCAKTGTFTTTLCWRLINPLFFRMIYHSCREAARTIIFQNWLSILKVELHGILLDGDTWLT